MQSVPTSMTCSSLPKKEVACDHPGSNDPKTNKESKIREIVTNVAGRIREVPAQLADAAESVQGKLSQKFTHSASHSEKRDGGGVYNPQLLQETERGDGRLLKEGGVNSSANSAEKHAPRIRGAISSKKNRVFQMLSRWSESS